MHTSCTARISAAKRSSSSPSNAIVTCGVRNVGQISNPAARRLNRRTVAVHLRNCFTKTGVTSRGELAQLDLA